ncbi:MAG: hypothetical protein GY711_16380 [bacterium]|nr:hypothetical protein [bacterium]
MTNTATVSTIDPACCVFVPCLPGQQGCRNVLHVRHHDATQGFILRPAVGQSPVERFTLVWDVYFDPGNADPWQVLWNDDSTGPGDLFLGMPFGGFWHRWCQCSTAGGTWNLGEWFRFVYVNDNVAGEARMYVNGALVFVDGPGGVIHDGAATLSTILQTTSPVGNVSECWVANFAFTDVVMNAQSVEALGGPHADGIFDLSGPIGMNYCGPAVANSSGAPARMSASGSFAVASNDVTLTASDLPPGQFGYFLVSRSSGNLCPPGSMGCLCIALPIGRYSHVSEIIQGPVGSIAIDLTDLPFSPPTPALPGDTLYFQCWYRDLNPTLTSNFSDGLQIPFQ